ncbi:MAG: nitroreductase family protein [Candidatus Natronoplasma sp.]
MNLMKIIKKRRSIRKFTDESIEREKIERLMEAARWAPSGGNLQPYVIKSVKGEKVDEIQRFSPGIYGRPLVILVFCVDEKKLEKKGGDEAIKYMDIAIAGENVCLMATEMGLGTCFIRSFNKKAIDKILDLDERYEPELIILVGYPDEEPDDPFKKKLADLVEWEGWDD